MKKAYIEDGTSTMTMNELDRIQKAFGKISFQIRNAKNPPEIFDIMTKTAEFLQHIGNRQATTTKIFGEESVEKQLYIGKPHEYLNMLPPTPPNDTETAQWVYKLCLGHGYLISTQQAALKKFTAAMIKLQAEVEKMNGTFIFKNKMNSKNMKYADFYLWINIPVGFGKHLPIDRDLVEKKNFSQVLDCVERSLPISLQAEPFFIGSQAGLAVNKNLITISSELKILKRPGSVENKPAKKIKKKC